MSKRVCKSMLSHLVHAERQASELMVNLGRSWDTVLCATRKHALGWKLGHVAEHLRGCPEYNDAGVWCWTVLFFVIQCRWRRQQDFVAQNQVLYEGEGGRPLNLWKEERNWDKHICKSSMRDFYISHELWEELTKNWITWTAILHKLQHHLRRTWRPNLKLKNISTRKLDPAPQILLLLLLWPPMQIQHW